MEKKCGTHLYRCETAPQAGTVIAQPRLALHHSGAQRCCVRCAPQHEGDRRRLSVWFDAGWCHPLQRESVLCRSWALDVEENFFSTNSFTRLITW